MRGVILKTGYEAVIFDMDGVIFDTEAVYLESCVTAAKLLGMGDVRELCLSCIGITAEKTKEKYAGAFGDTQLLEKFWVCAKELASGQFEKEIPVKSGAREILEYLNSKNIPLVLASSTKTEIVIKELILTNLFRFFKKIIGGDTVQHSKPHPEIFLKASDIIKIPPEKCIVIEDSFNGVRAAKAAGMQCVMIPDLLQPDDEISSLADYIMPSLDELKKQMESDNL